mgnify:CR=1 FL=1
MLARLSNRWIAAGLLAVIAGGFGPGARGQASDVAKPTPAVVGSANCAGCHQTPERYAGESLICRMVEYPIWKEKDRHQIAYQVLLGDRSREMGKRLGIDVTDARNSCVRCHGVVPPSGVRPFQFEAKADGVTCIACHGGAEEWIAEHQFPNSPRWRNLTRADKQRLKGMRDLWDPRTRVETCFSCHIGNADENKVLTHAMYAAGHPPLPSIEVASFSEEQPRHWQYLREKPEAIQKHLGFNPNRLEQTELVAVSGLAALSATIRQLVDPPNSAGNESVESSGPDFARYDCAACHHELKVWDRSWRQAREEGHAPGRPAPPAWPRALVRLGLEAADPARAEGWFRGLSTRMEAFDAAMTARPFGDLDRARPIAEAVLKLLDEPLRALDDQTRVKPGQPGRVIDRAEALRLLRRIAPIADELVHDYESARQMAWAFRTIYHEVEPDASKRDPRIVAGLAALDRKLGLSLNAGKSAERRPILEMLGDRLKAMSNYEPAEFRKAIEGLTRALPSD